MSKTYRIGIVGATGAVGRELLVLLLERSFPAEEIVLLASARSAGKEIEHAGKKWTIREAAAKEFDDLDVALFSAGSGTSKELGPKAVERGCVVVDNSSAFRMNEGVPLVIPEINADALRSHNGLIANPNCSTIVALMGVYPLHQAFGLKRFFASTYQAVSGAGAVALAELEKQAHSWAKGEEMKPEAFPHQIAFNLLPHVGAFLENGYTEEEMKMQNEGAKIMSLPGLRVSTTCVRVPVLRAHSIAVNAEFERPVDLEAARRAIADFPGTELCDEPESATYPMPWDYSGKINCGVGRLRIDTALENGLSLWCVGDQLWKGAALNAIQIAEQLHADDLLRVPAAVREA